MTLIDTSAWIEFLRREGHVGTKNRVATLISNDEAAYPCPVLMELLAGAKDGREETLVRQALGLCERLFFSPASWEEAAQLERALRGRGVTVPRDDILVAAAALGAQMPLLCRDGHFDLIRRKAAHALRVEQV